MEHKGSVNCVASGSAGAPKDEIEVTPEMIRAGAAVLSPKTVANLMDCWASPTDVAEKVFRAMIQAAR